MNIKASGRQRLNCRLGKRSATQRLAVVRARKPGVGLRLRLTQPACLLLATALLAACAPLLTPKSAPQARFDLGAGGVEAAADARPIAFELRAAPTLDTPAMRYRLNYADSTRVLEYSRARWAGTTTEILEQYLKSHLNQQATRSQNTKRCRFDLELLRFEQVFTSAEASLGAIIVRARLQSPGQGVLEESNLELTAPAPTPDANGGVKALALAADRLAQELSRRFAAQGCQN